MTNILFDPQWVIWGIMLLIIFAVNAVNDKTFLKAIGNTILALCYVTFIGAVLFGIFWVIRKFGDALLWFLESLIKPLSVIIG